MMVNYFTFSVEALDIPPDLTSAKERSELLKCKCVNVAWMCFCSCGITQIGKAVGHYKTHIPILYLYEV